MPVNQKYRFFFGLGKLLHRYTLVLKDKLLNRGEVNIQRSLVGTFR